MSQPEHNSTVESPPQKSALRKTIGWVAGSIAAIGFGAAICSVSRPPTPMTGEKLNEHIVDVNKSIDAYREAVNACLATPNTQTAERLNYASLITNRKYFEIEPDLTLYQELDVGVPIQTLNKEAEEVIKAIRPQTRYTLHFANSIESRRKVLLLQSQGDQKALEQYLRKRYQDDKDNPVSKMNAAEQRKYMSQPVEPKE